MKFIAAVLFLLASACGPMPTAVVKAGDACTSIGTSMCQNDTTWLLCNRELKWKPFTCTGPRGCALAGPSGATTCDFTRSQTLDPCPTEADGVQLPAGSTALGFCMNSTVFIFCNPNLNAFDARSCSSCTTSSDVATCQP